jgi:predicted transcriptional regulator
MFVEDMLETARAGLVSIADDAKLIEGARLLTTGPDFVVVCDGTGVLKGVVTKTDVVRQISVCGARPASPRFRQ